MGELNLDPIERCFNNQGKDLIPIISSYCLCCPHRSDNNICHLTDGARQARPATGLMLVLTLLGEYRPGSLPSDKLSELLKEMETCAGEDDGCQRCAHQVECVKSFDELIGRVK